MNISGNSLFIIEVTIIIVHIEPQSYFEKEFQERMFIYNSRLYEYHRKPILHIAVFSCPDKRDVSNQFTISFPALKIQELYALDASGKIFFFWSIFVFLQ